MDRSVAIRLGLIDALQFHEKNGEVCPANWNKGDRAMTEDVEGVQSYFQDVKILEKS